MYKKARCDIVNVIKKDLSKIIKEFDKLPYKSYERRRLKHEPNDSYFYLARQIAKCMMSSDALNSYVYPVRTEMTSTNRILVFHGCSMDEIELKEFLVNKTIFRYVLCTGMNQKSSSMTNVLRRKKN